MQEAPIPAPDEFQRLRVENERLRRDRDELRKVLDEIDGRTESIASARLKVHAAELSKDIKKDFWESVQRGLWAVAIVGSIATAGGIVTLSDILRNRIDAAVEGKHNEIEKLREGVVSALVDVKLRAEAANREVEALKADLTSTLSKAKKQVQDEGAATIATLRGLTVSVTSTVDATGRTSTVASAKVKSPTQSQSSTEVTVVSESNWFGPLPRGFVGVAGSSFYQVGVEEGARGAFSLNFFRLLMAKTADINSDGRVSIREAVTMAAQNLRSQTPVLVGDRQDEALFSLTRVSAASRPKGRLVVLLIGINEYAGKNVPSLRGPVSDVQALATLFRDTEHVLASNVVVTQLLNEKATLTSIQNTLDSLAGSTTAEDTFVFYYSGHQTNIPGGGGKAPVKALIPHDFSVGAQLLIMPELVGRISKILAKTRILIADV